MCIQRAHIMYSFYGFRFIGGRVDACCLSSIKVMMSTFNFQMGFMGSRVASSHLA